MAKQVFLPEKKKEEPLEFEGAIIKVRSTKKKQIENLVLTKKRNVVGVIRDWINADRKRK
jgi:flagellar biosynthesis/type III secretory pathway M-ring protein FliF/YscJ